MDFASLPLDEAPLVRAPDGSQVRVLLALGGGSMAHFHLPAAAVAEAVAHRTVEEIWYVLSGRGRMWRKQGGHEQVVELAEGLCLSIPAGTHFQFRASPDAALSAVAITMPPWPGADEAMFVAGPWEATEA
jgi:mannose-6-phosphate isomerase-like protein (cupin superfamily)